MPIQDYIEGQRLKKKKRKRKEKKRKWSETNDGMRWRPSGIIRPQANLLCMAYFYSFALEKLLNLPICFKLRTQTQQEASHSWIIWNMIAVSGCDDNSCPDQYRNWIRCGRCTKMLLFSFITLQGKYVFLNIIQWHILRGWVPGWYRRIPKVTAPVTFGISSPIKGP